MRPQFRNLFVVRARVGLFFLSSVVAALSTAMLKFSDEDLTALLTVGGSALGAATK